MPWDTQVKDMTETLAKQALRLTKRVEVRTHNVHTSQGKLLRGLRVTLPTDEANQLILAGHAVGVRGVRPAAPECEPMTVDITPGAPDLDSGPLSADELPDGAIENSTGHLSNG